MCVHTTTFFMKIQNSMHIYKKHHRHYVHCVCVWIPNICMEYFTVDNNIVNENEGLLCSSNTQQQNQRNLPPTSHCLCDSTTTSTCLKCIEHDDEEERLWTDRCNDNWKAESGRGWHPKLITSEFNFASVDMKRYKRLQNLYSIITGQEDDIEEI